MEEKNCKGFCMVLCLSNNWELWISIGSMNYHKSIQSKNKSSVRYHCILYVLQNCVWSPSGGFKQWVWESSGFNLYFSGLAISSLEVFSSIHYSVYQNYRSFNYFEDNSLRCLKEKLDTEMNRTDPVSAIETIINKKTLYKRPNSSWNQLRSFFLPQVFFYFLLYCCLFPYCGVL